MEHPGPAGGAAEPLRGAGVPSQRDRRQPAPHGPSGPSSEPAAGTARPAARHLQTQPAPAQWAEQCRVPAAREGLVCERQLVAGRHTVGGGQHRHRTETGLRDTLASLQARPVHPLEQTLPQAGDPCVRLGGPPDHVLRGQDGGASLPDSEAAVVQISAGNRPWYLGEETTRAGTVPAVGL
ncbi:double-stranded RNA-specific editase B2 isoform X3, partial [Lates japonicus]